jgi:hypothetical protein
MSPVFRQAAEAGKSFGAEIGNVLERVGKQSFETQKGAQELHHALQEAFENPLGALRAFAHSLESELLAALGPTGIAAGALIGVFAGGGFAMYEFAKGAAEAGSQLQDMAVKAGTSVETMGALKFAAGALGGSAEELSNSMFMMGKRIESGSTAVQDGLGKLGLSWKQFAELQPDEQLLQISDAMRSLPPEVNKGAIAFELFGRQGRDMLPKLVEPMRELFEQGKSFNTWTEESTAKSKEFEISLNILGMEMRKLGETIGKDLLERIMQWVEAAKESKLVTEGLPALGHLIAAGFDRILDAADGLVKVIDFLIEKWDNLPPVLKNIAETALITAAGLWGLNKAAESLGGMSLGETLSDWSSFTSNLSQTFGTSLPTAVKSTVAALMELKAMTVAFGWEGFAVTIGGWLAPLTAAWAGLNSLAVGAMGAAGAMGMLASAALPILALGGIAAVGTAAYQAWKLWREEAERGAAAARQSQIDQTTLAQASKLAGHEITNMSEAVKILNKNSAEQRGETEKMGVALAKLSEEQKLAKLNADLHSESTVRLSDGVMAYIKAAIDQGKTVEQVAKALIAMKVAGEEAKPIIEQMHAAHKAAGEAAKKHAEELKRLAEATADANSSMTDLSGAQVEAIRWYHQQKVGVEEIAKVMGVYKHQVEQVVQADKDEEAALKAKAEMQKHMSAMYLEGMAVAKAFHDQELGDIKANLDDELALRREHENNIIQETEGTYAVQRKQVQDWLDDQRAKLAKRGGDWSRAWAEAEQVAEDRLNNIEADEQAFYRKSAADGAALIPKGFSDAFAKIGESIPGFIQSAFTGGGGMSGALAGIGSKAGESLFGSMFGNIEHVVGSEVVGGKGIASVLQGVLPKAFSSAIPFIGPAVGALIGPAIQGLKSLFGGGEEGTKVNGPRQQFIDAAGGLAVLNQKMMEATGSISLVQSLLGAKTEKAYKAAVDDINKSLGQWNDAMKASKTALDGVSSKMKSTTEMTPELEAALKKAYDSKSLDAYQKALKEVNGILDGQTQQTQELEAAMQKYGLSWEDMGDKARGQHMGQLALDIVKDFNVLHASGVDINFQMEKMAPTLKDFVKTAQKAGVEIPNEMKPVLQAAIDAGQLFDDNGDKITDMSKLGLTFGDTMSQSMQKVVDAVQKLVDVLSKGLPTAIANIPDIDVNATIHGQWDVPDMPGIKQEAEGGSGRVTGPTLFYSAGNEDFAFSGEGKSFGGSGSGGGGGGSEDLRSLMRALPMMISNAVKGATQRTPGGRR